MSLYCTKLTNFIASSVQENFYLVFSIASSVTKIFANKIVSLYSIFFSKIVYLYRFKWYIFEYRCPPLTICLKIQKNLWISNEVLFAFNIFRWFQELCIFMSAYTYCKLNARIFDYLRVSLNILLKWMEKGFNLQVFSCIINKLGRHTAVPFLWLLQSNIL